MSNGWSTYTQEQPQYPGNYGSQHSSNMGGGGGGGYGSYPTQQHHSQQMQQQQHQQQQDWYASQQQQPQQQPQAVRVRQQQQQPYQSHSHQHQMYDNVSAEQQQWSTQGGQQGYSHQMPRHQFEMNVHAPSFTPRTGGGPGGGGGGSAAAGAYQQQQQHPQQQQQPRNTYDNYGPAYASAPMYGMAGYREPNYYQNHVQSCPPSMTQYYAGEAQEEYNYDQMYSVAAQQYVPSHELQSKMMGSGQTAILTEIQVGLEQLMSDADEFESWAGAIKDRIADKTMTPESRLTAIHIATEMAVAGSPNAINAGNPQYCFAKLMAYLCKELPHLLGESVLPTLHHFHEQRTQMDAEPKHNLMLFFAESFDKIETTAGGKIKKLGEALMDQLDELIRTNASVNDASMKAVIQIMKLTGHSLDAIQELRPRVDELLTKLSGYAKGHHQLSESIKTQIGVLIELREKGWGYTDKIVSASSSGAIIGADGRSISLSEEERDFLESHFGTLEGDGEDNGQNTSDLEMMKDYEQYLKEQQAQEASTTADLMTNMSLSNKKEDSSDNPSS